LLQLDPKFKKEHSSERRTPLKVRTAFGQQ